MKLLKTVFAKLLLISALLGLSSMALAQEEDPVGLILSTSGSVSAESESGEVR